MPGPTYTIKDTVYRWRLGGLMRVISNYSTDRGHVFLVNDRGLEREIPQERFAELLNTGAIKRVTHEIDWERPGAYTEVAP